MAKKRKCSDFNHELEYPYQCKYFIGEDDTKRCVFINNQCEEQFINCEDYNENVQPNICESIQPYNDIEESIYYIYKCVYNNGNCQKILRNCDDFRPEEEDEYFCYLLSPIDESKKCIYSNGNCIEL